MVKQIDGFGAWLAKIRLLLGIAALIIGTITMSVLGYAAICNDISTQGSLITGQGGEIKDLQVRVDTHTLAILKVQTQLDMIQEKNQEYQEESRRNFRQIIERLK